MQTRIVTQHIPLSLEGLPTYQAETITKTNNINAYIWNVAQALKEAGTNYYEVIERRNEDGEPYGYYQIRNAANAEMGLFFSSAYNTPAKVEISGIWPELKYQKLTDNRRPEPFISTERFTPHGSNAPRIGQSITVAPEKAAKDIMKRFLPAYHAEFTKACDVRHAMKKSLDAEQRAAEILKSQYPKQAYVGGSGIMFAYASHANGTVQAEARNLSGRLSVKLDIDPALFPQVVALMGSLKD